MANLLKCNDTPPGKLSIAQSVRYLRSLVQDDFDAMDTLIQEIGKTKVELIIDMAGHIIGSGGKRLRPLLTLVSAKLCNYNQDNHHIHLAAAVECMHTATLLHDDVVDESMLRRGEVTANNLWGNKESVLVGDFLLGQAFCLMVRSGNIRVLDILSNAAAVISEGEVMQLEEAQNVSLSQEKYMQIITAKTAILFSAACEVIPVAANKSEDEITALRNFGLHLGIAFQIVDDVLDYSAKQEALGKTIGDDFREGKLTLPVILAYQQANDEEKAFWQRSMADKQQQPQDLAQAISYINQHNSLTQSMHIAHNYAKQAADALDIFGESKEKKALLDVLFFSLDREF